MFLEKHFELHWSMLECNHEEKTVLFNQDQLEADVILFKEEMGDVIFHD